MELRIDFTAIRFWLLLALVFFAPMSLYPSVALPLFDFPSFRIGLYQILAVAFVLSSLPLMWRAVLRLKQHQSLSILLILLIISLAVGLATSYVLPRTILYSGSLLALIALGGATYLTAIKLKAHEVRWVLRTTLLSGVVFGALSLLQLLLATFQLDPLGVLCAGCTSAVFGFPRINLFAAEPQFLANSLLPALFIASTLKDKRYTWLAPLALVLSSIAIALTLSRGAYAAIVAAFVVYVLVLLIRRNHEQLRRAVHSTVTIGLSFFVGFTLLVASASWLYRTTPNITYNTSVSALSHVTLGVVNLPEKPKETSPLTHNQPIAPAEDTFDPQGFVPASSNERLDAASLALDAWNDTPFTMLFGVGMGNLGAYVRAHIFPEAPPTLTVYIFYILLLSELGLVGLGLFIYMIFYVLKIAYSRISTPVGAIAWCLMIAFTVQFAFFGSYINVMYIPVWIGLLSAWLHHQRTTKAIW